MTAGQGAQAPSPNVSPGSYAAGVDDSLFPALPKPPRRFTVTVTLSRGRDDSLLPSGAHALAELAAAAVAAEGLVTAWTSSQSVLYMVLEASCAADALDAGAVVARTIGGADGAVSVAAEPVPATGTGE